MSIAQIFVFWVLRIFVLLCYAQQGLEDTCNADHILNLHRVQQQGETTHEKKKEETNVLLGTMVMTCCSKGTVTST